MLDCNLGCGIALNTKFDFNEKRKSWILKSLPTL